MENIITISILGYYTAKIILYAQKRYAFENKGIAYTVLMVLIPFSEFFYSNKVKNKLKVSMSEALGTAAFFIAGAGIYSRTTSGEYIFDFDLMVFLVFIFTLFFMMLYLAIQDLYTFEIRADLSNLMVILVVLANVILGSARVILDTFFDIDPNKFFYFTKIGTIDALLGFALGFFLIWLLVKASNEKYIGIGDADILAVIGGTLGVSALAIGIFSTSIIGSIFGIIYAVRSKKFHGLIVPMVPFLLLGYLIAFSYTETILDFLIPGI